MDERIHHAVEDVERVRGPERRRQGSLDRDGLRRELPENDVQRRDQSERDRDGDRVGGSRRETADQKDEWRFEQCRDRRLAEPAEGERRQGMPTWHAARYESRWWVMYEAIRARPLLPMSGVSCVSRTLTIANSA